jgi:hypothetical protein
MAEVLYAPNREQLVTTNAWAFLHWLRTTLRVDLSHWAALQRWSVHQPADFAAAILAFAGNSLPPSAGGTWGAGARALADCLLFADVRPDDRLFAAEPDCPDPLAGAAREQATILLAPAKSLAGAAFRRTTRPDLADLRTIIATGGPMSPEARRRIYTWVKADVMLLARAGDTYWGNPLDPVLARPPATPAFLTQRPSARLPR